MRRVGLAGGPCNLVCCSVKPGASGSWENMVYLFLLRIACSSAEEAVEAAHGKLDTRWCSRSRGTVSPTGQISVALPSISGTMRPLPGWRASFWGCRAPASVTVESMVTDAVAEMIVGVTRDPTLGLGLTIGTGGIFAEVLQDSDNPPVAGNPR